MVEQIDVLIKLYSRLGSGSFCFLFGNDPRKFFARISYDQIRLTWTQILNVFKTRIGLEKMASEHISNQVELDQLLLEIVALEDLEFSLDLAISDNRKRGFSPSEENEKLLMKNLERNSSSIWG